mgnify:CR=1 FL=1
MCTHLGSASKALYDALETNSRIQGYKSQNINIYHSNYNLINLMETNNFERSKKLYYKYDCMLSNKITIIKVKICRLRIIFSLNLSELIVSSFG